MDLTSVECEELLRSGVAGRIAVATANGPHIVPINYSVVDDALIFRTSPYSLLGTFARNAMIAFEVDHVDYENQHGWSVVARGRCQSVDDPQEVERIRSVWPPRPWAAGSRNLFLRLAWTEISGRRLGTHWSPVAELPVRRVISGNRS